MNNTGGPAFPTERNLTQGMTLRDYFAAKVINGLCAGFAATEKDWPDSDDPDDYDVVAWHAYRMADAMLKARES
jgi:hypothetical protein